jgi:hypothetical protein
MSPDVWQSGAKERPVVVAQFAAEMRKSDYRMELCVPVRVLPVLVNKEPADDKACGGSIGVRRCFDNGLVLSSAC